MVALFGVSLRDWTRRQFLKTLGGGIASAALMSACGWRNTAREIPGKIVGAKANWGHRLREITPAANGASQRTDVVIVGGGIAGLAAARQLRREGIEDVVVLELDDQAGGNSRSGANAVSAFPWGAHYVPLVNQESIAVLELFQELNIIQGRDLAGRPRYDEYFLCAEPEERLFRNGHWQEGLIPRVDISTAQAAEIQRFLDSMETFRQAKGSDGKRAFAIPLEESSVDTKYRELDALTMAAWLKAHNFTDPTLLWYVDYCCRDDYGAAASQISAWAGIHYFAGRHAEAANAEANTVLTWPAGNGWLVEKLQTGLEDRLHCGRLVSRIAREGESWNIQSLDHTGTAEAWRARAVVYAAPRFTAPYVIEDLRRSNALKLTRWQYSPWLVANLTLSKTPDAEGAAPAWDNVLFGSRGLGYVNATHQSLRSRPGKTVWTYYRPLDERSPQEERAFALKRSFIEWRDGVLADLSSAHPNLSEVTERLDVWIWGHGMIRPSLGFLWGKDGRGQTPEIPGLYFAHSDMSGISIFEEAYERGVAAARSIANNFRGGKAG